MSIIPFNRPFIVGKELYYIAQAVVESHLSGDGPFTKRCQKWFEERLGCAKALLTHSCTGALEMAAMLCGIEPGDEIIMPSFTFVSTANAFVLRTGMPVFVDIKEDTLNIDETLIEQAITPRTKAIVPVHYAGGSCNMDEIMDIAERHGLFVVEDAAQALLSTYKERYLGTIGHFGCLSFHETKNIISGEGGALIINDEKFVERAEILWEKGTNRKQFFRGEVDKYTWVDIGSSFLPSELVGAFLYAQLEQAEKIMEARTQIFRQYLRVLGPLGDDGVIRLPAVEYGSNGHIFYIITRSSEERCRLIEYLKENGIWAVFHYVPLHSSPAGAKYGRTSEKLRVTDDLSDRVLRLPVYYEMREEDVERVAEHISQFYGG
ncbi:MAG: dTDP-4-amino-4,6-dideoxygalactose transaminase [Desulfobacterales bacterium PC51MH44]|nr:MAG: dTDP-4-amino-4,6-dideoxygalactose transaminase [Desulfobacterales bacterium PC51MH44]